MSPIRAAIEAACRRSRLPLRRAYLIVDLAAYLARPALWKRSVADCSASFTASICRPISLAIFDAALDRGVRPPR